MKLTAAEQQATLYGARALEVGELLEMLVGKKLPCTAKELAGKTVYEIQQMGLTPKQATKVVAAVELGRRAQQPEIGYQQLLETTGVQLITKLKRNMKQKLMPLSDRLMLHKRSIVETIIDQLKNISQIEHSRHRSPVNCFVNILCGLIRLLAPTKKARACYRS